VQLVNAELVVEVVGDLGLARGIAPAQHVGGDLLIKMAHLL